MFQVADFVIIEVTNDYGYGRTAFYILTILTIS